MNTNDLKKGTRITLRNGWAAELFDNRKGNTRLAKVFGDYTEIGSIYSHDIMLATVRGHEVKVDHTPSQIKLRDMLKGLFG